jgi:hypothetical protein
LSLGRGHLFMLEAAAAGSSSAVGGGGTPAWTSGSHCTTPFFDTRDGATYVSLMRISPVTLVIAAIYGPQEVGTCCLPLVSCMFLHASCSMQCMLGI